MPSILNKALPAKGNSYNVYVNVVSVQSPTDNIDKLSSSANNYEMLDKRSEFNHGM